VQCGCTVIYICDCVFRRDGVAPTGCTSFSAELCGSRATPSVAAVASSIHIANAPSAILHTITYAFLSCMRTMKSFHCETVDSGPGNTNNAN
jgi:hypothetical protein